MIVAELLTRLGFKVEPKELNQGVEKAKSVMSEFKSFLGKLTLGYGFAEIAKSVVHAAAEIESMQAQLETMTGSVAKSNELFSQMRDFATHSAYQLKDIVGSATVLIQGGVGLSRVNNTLKMFGDVAGADTEQFKALAFSYSHLMQLGRLTARSQGMFMYSGHFNPLREYAKMQIEAAGLIHKGDEIIEGSAADAALKRQTESLEGLMHQGKFTAEMVEEAFQHATTAGGMYYKHNEKQMNTFQGKWTTMLDNLQLHSASAAQKLFPIFKALMDFVGNLPLEWLGSAFSYIANAIQYMASVIEAGGLNEYLEILKESLGELLRSLVEAAGGSAGAGDSIRELALIMSFLITRFIIGVSVIFKFAAALARYKLAVAAVGFALAYAFASSKITAIGAVARAINGFKLETVKSSAAVKFLGNQMESFRISKVGALKVAMMDLKTVVLGARGAMNNFFSSSSIGMGMLVMATTWAIGKIVEAYHALRDLLSEEGHQDRMAQIAELQTQKGLNTQAKARYLAKGDVANANRMDWRNLSLDQQIKDIQSKEAPASGSGEDQSMDEFMRQMNENAKRSQDLEAAQLAEAKKQSAMQAGAPNSIAIALHNHAGASRTGMLPDDVLKLAERAVRASFEVHLRAAAVEAAA